MLQAEALPVLWRFYYNPFAVYFDYVTVYVNRQLWEMMINIKLHLQVHCTEFQTVQSSAEIWTC